MRQLFTVGAILAFFMLTPVARAQVLPLLDVELGEAEREDLARLASVDTPAEMLKFLEHAHGDLELRTFPQEKTNHRGQYEARFNEGPKGILTLASDVDREEIFHEYMRYLIDRARLRRHAHFTLKRQVSYESWMRSIGRSLELQGSANYTERMLLLRNALEGLVLRYGEEVEIVVYLIRNAEKLGLGDLERQRTSAYHDLRALTKEWIKVIAQSGDGEIPAAAVPDMKRIHDIGSGLHIAYPIVGDCGPELNVTSKAH